MEVLLHKLDLQAAKIHQPFLSGGPKRNQLVCSHLNLLSQISFSAGSPGVESSLYSLLKPVVYICFSSQWWDRQRNLSSILCVSGTTNAGAELATCIHCLKRWSLGEGRAIVSILCSQMPARKVPPCRHSRRSSIENVSGASSLSKCMCASENTPSRGTKIALDPLNSASDFTDLSQGQLLRLNSEQFGILASFSLQVFDPSILGVKSFDQLSFTRKMRSEFASFSSQLQWDFFHSTEAEKIHPALQALTYIINTVLWHINNQQVWLSDRFFSSCHPNHRVGAITEEVKILSFTFRRTESSSPSENIY